MGGMGGMGGAMPMMPMMPMMPCLPACSMPMMAASCPLPVACSPLVQSYQTPLPFQFSSGFGSSFGNFLPQYNPSSGMSCCCCVCAPPLPPAISYYPRPVSVPQPYPVPCPIPVAIPNIQQVPVPRHVSVVAPPIFADCNSPGAVPSGAPLMPSAGGFTQGTAAQSLVMASNKLSTKETLLNDDNSKDSKRRRPIHKTVDQSRRAKAEKIAASLSKLGLTDNLHSDTISRKGKHAVKSTRRIRKLSHDDISLISLSKNNYISLPDHLTSDRLSTLLDKSNQNSYSKSSRRR
ncbi:unnamed protein product [Rotaria socialis]|nr:unnamed protein product [Rotaria socialis]